MSVSIVQFSAAHLEPAALLAARHRRDRLRVPNLPPAYERAPATLPVLQNLFAADDMSGVVVLHGGSIVGYLLGSPVLRAPTHAFADFRESWMTRWWVC